jgi:predicted aspartyl protease
MLINFSKKSLMSMVISSVGTSLALTTALAIGATTIDEKNSKSATWYESPSEPAGNQHEHTLPSMFHKGFVYIKVAINGHPGAWMILDTGSTNSIIDKSYADSIGLKLTPSTESQETFGTVKTETFETEKIHLSVGSEQNRDVFFQSFSLGGMMGPNGLPAAGMLGHTFLDGKSIVIDYKASEVYFENLPSPSDLRDVPMTIKVGVGIPGIKLKIDNHMIDSLIDTGGTYGMIITPDTAKELGIENLMNEAKPANTVGHGGEQHIVVGKAPPFSIGQLNVRDQSAAYTTFGTATESISAGVSLGIGFLKHYKLTLNYASNTVRFEP